MTFKHLANRLLFWRKPKFKSFGTEMATKAFTHNGKAYYQFADNFKMPAGRAICALAIYEELRMRCTADYLKLHIEATEKILNGATGKIRLTDLAQINTNLKERLNLAPFPDHIYKLASVVFFDDTESPYSYDFEYNQKKIADWKKDGEMLYFFLSMPFKDLISLGSLSKERQQNYFNTTEMVNQIHHKHLQGLLSKKG
jgi:hypothetical protein